MHMSNRMCPRSSSAAQKVALDQQIAPAQRKSMHATTVIAVRFNSSKCWLTWANQMKTCDTLQNPGICLCHGMLLQHAQTCSWKPPNQSRYVRVAL